MARKIIIGSLIIVFILVAWFFVKNLSESKKMLPPIERMVDTRESKSIAGSFWTSKFDCTYKNPPKEKTVTMLPFSCDAASHNVRVLEKGESWFTPRSTADDNPPFCLVTKPADSNAIDMAKEREFLYCRASWSIWQYFLHGRIPKF